MFEVSESLMLAQQEKFFPISKTMYLMLSRPDGPGMACALGVVAFIVTLLGILGAAKISGRKFEELFSIS
jgi:iron(III) transport system permease protein